MSPIRVDLFPRPLELQAPQARRVRRVRRDCKVLRAQLARKVILGHRVPPVR
jgi:hypothetical protein